MDQFDRHLRQEVVRFIADKEPRGFGLPQRRRGSIGFGVLALLVFVIILLVVGCDRSMDDVDGLCIEYRVVAEDGDISPETLEQVRVITENRVHTLGVADPIVQSRRSDRIEVALPGIESGTEDADQALELIGTTGVLEFMPVPPELQGRVGEGPLPEGMLDTEPLFTGVEIASAAIAQDQTTRELVVDLQLKETGARLFDEYAADHYGDQFAIVLDGEVTSAPTIQARRFGGRAQISGGQGGFDPGEAQALVTVLRFGALPLELADVRAWACGGPRDVAGASQHIEVPEVGIALTYPAGWDVVAAPWDPLDADRDLLGWYQVMAHGPDGAEHCDLYTWRRVDGSDVSLDEETDSFIEGVRADPETELLPTTETDVLLPATDASRVDFEGHGNTYGYWHVADGAHLHQLACHAPTASEDHWASIARTIELTAVEPSPLSGPTTRRIETDGVSVAFPDTWTIEESIPPERRRLLSGSASRPLWGPLIFARRDSETCAIIDVTAYANGLDFWRIEDALKWEIGGYRPAPDGIVSARAARRALLIRPESTSTTIVSLPVGRTAVIDIEGKSGGNARQYLTGRAPGRWLYLSCETPNEAPGDLWLSIAESITVEPPWGATAAATPTATLLPPEDLEAVFADGVPFDDCSQQPPDSVSGAVAVMTCRVDDDVEVTYAQFGDPEALDDWWAQASASTRTFPEATTASRCRSGASGEAAWSLQSADDPTGRFMCHLPRLDASVSWTDDERLMGASVIGETSSLPSLYERWSRGEFHLGRSAASPTPAATPIPAAMSLNLTEAALREIVPFDDCRSRKLDTVPGAEAVITCPAGEWVEVTYAQFGGIADLEDWWEQEAGSIRTWPTPTAASRCESGANAEAAWILDGSDLPAGRFACHLPDLLAAVSWTDTALLMGGRVDGDTTALPDIYSRWSQGEFDPDRTRPTEGPEPTKGPTTTEPATEAHAFAGLFPPNWTVERADPDDHFWLFPVVEDDVQWQPVAYATDGTDECALIDATAYADELGFDTIEDALEWELTGFDEDADRAWVRLVSVTSLSSPETATGKYLVWALEEIAFVDVEPESGEFQRHYLHYDGTRWVYFSCRSSDPPDDHWLPQALAVSYEPFEQLVQPVPTPAPSSREARLRDLVPLKDCESRPTRSVAGANAVISCDATADISVDYMTFQSPDALQAWWDRQAGSAESVPGIGAIERCEAGEAVESGWYLERVNRLAGRYLCKPATSVRLPTVAWTYEPLLMGGRVTSGDHDLPDLFQRWQRGTYGVEQG